MQFVQGCVAKPLPSFHAPLYYGAILSFILLALVILSSQLQLVWVLPLLALPSALLSFHLLLYYSLLDSYQ